MEFRPARAGELPRLCEMLESAKERLRLLGLTQWQSGIPNGEMLAADIAAGRSFVLAEQGELLASAAICFGEDESYREIDGAWPNNEPYAAIHRVFTAQDALRKGCGCKKRKRSACGAACATCGSTHTGETSPCRPFSAGAASPCAE